MFQQRELREAITYASEGGQALHLHVFLGPRAPNCFKRDIAAGKQIAHLFDHDHRRLVETVKQLGVNVVRVERIGTPRQHVDLCGRPLEKALTLCQSNVGGNQWSVSPAQSTSVTTRLPQQKPQ